MRERAQFTMPARRAATAIVLSTLMAGCAAAPPDRSTAAPSQPSPSFPPVTASLQPAELANVSLQPEHAATATIGAAGGQVQLSDASGTQYRLDIPPAALTADISIVATPIDDIDGVPEELAVAGGLHLEPEGLRLGSMAELTITLAGPPAGALAPFAYHADLEQPHRYPATIDGAAVTFGIAHFSGYALLKATQAATTAEELGLLIPFDLPSGADDQALAAIAAVIDAPASPTREQAIHDALRTWLDSGIRPLVTQFRGLTSWTHDGPYSEKSFAVRVSLNLWAYVEQLLVVAGAWPADPSLAADIDSLVVSAATHGIATSNTDCRAAGTGLLLVLRLPEQFSWLRIAGKHGVTGSAPVLDEAFVLEHLCVQVIYDPNGGTEFPSGIQPGQSGTLNVRAGIRIEDIEDRFDALPNITVTPHGAEPSSMVSGETDGDGRFTRQFLWDPASPELRLDIDACLSGALSAVCQQAFVVRGVSTPTAGQCPRFEMTADGVTRHGSDYSEGASVDQGRIAGDLNVSITAFGGVDVSATGVVHYLVEATGSDQGPFEILVSFQGSVTDDVGGLATIAVAVEESSDTFTSPKGGTDVRLDFPLTVAPGDIFRVELRVDANSTAESIDLNPHGSITIAQPPEIIVYAVECSET